jgi:hypothetical protein
VPTSSSPNDSRQNGDRSNLSIARSSEAGSGSRDPSAYAFPVTGAEQRHLALDPVRARV